MALISTRRWQSTRRLRRVEVDVPTDVPSTDAIFLVLRRMRFPLIVLITIFSISVLGLALLPGVDDEGNTWRMSLFDAFYFISYTATTIGFGELNHTFTTPQRMWVTLSIFASVTGWAYVFGSLFALLQEPAFRKAVSLQRFRSKVKGIHEPFLLLAGYGQAGRTLAMALDHTGRRLVVVDEDPSRIDVLTADQLASDVPAIEGDPRNPALLGLAGLGHPMCEGVIAMTDKDEMNLAVVMAADLLRPEVPVITRCSERANVSRMLDFTPHAVINPYDRYGSYLVMQLNRPATHQLSSWLMSEAGTEMPPMHDQLANGRWMVSADGRFGHEVALDLRNAGLEVIEVAPEDGMPDFTDIVGFVAGAESDTTNLSMAAHARLVNPEIYLSVRQKSIHTTSLLRAFEPDSVFIATDLVAFETLARLESPLYWGFVEHVQTMDNDEALALRERITSRLDRWCPIPRLIPITQHSAPAVFRWLDRGHKVTLDFLLRDPDDRDHPIEAIPYMLKRGDEITYLPSMDSEVRIGDEVGLLCRGRGLSQLNATLYSDASVEYLCTAREVPSTWVWRMLRGIKNH
ncbi:ion channel [Luteococcus japonicus]|uniref:Ion channel n=1 Tax=Luteococcus japonicus TaxID=33984 RepID=A0A3N1ZV42_9ACTN|nr:potassium channel protein [Luteococcus japonicus]ROR54734.1 ion channel [Luteococcus japonicus]